MIQTKVIVSLSSQMMLPDSLRGRMAHTTTLLHTDDTHKQLVAYGGVDETSVSEGDDEDTWVPLADTTIVEIGEGMHAHVLLYKTSQ